MKETHDGRNLQIFGAILSIIIGFASIVLGVVHIVMAADSRNFMEAGGVTGILTLIIGPLSAYVLCLVLRGFGTIVRKYENDEDDGKYKDDRDYDDGEWVKSKPKTKRTFLNMIGIEDVGDDEDDA